MTRMSLFRRFLLVLVVFLVTPAVSHATVELGLNGRSPVLIQDVYNHGGIAYIALDEALPALGMRGHWNSVKHVYTIRTFRGKALIFPGCRYLRFKTRFIPLPHPPLFMDGKLRVAEDFLYDQLASLVAIAVHFHNRDPFDRGAPVQEETERERLFAFLLKKKEIPAGAGLRGLVIDPGHGGADPGCVGLDGVKEKNVVLSVARLLAKNVKMRMGIPVFLTRDKDYSLSVKQRLQMANEPQVDAFVLLHAQASFSPEAQGISLFIRPEEHGQESVGHALAGGSALLADCLADRFKSAGFRVHPVQAVDLLPLGHGDLPTVLIEMGYLTTAGDNRNLTDLDHQKKFAAVCLEAIQDYSDTFKEAVP